MKYTIIHAVRTKASFYIQPIIKASRVECTQEALSRYLRVLSPWFVFEGWSNLVDGSEPEMLDTDWCDREYRYEKKLQKRVGKE